MRPLVALLAAGLAATPAAAQVGPGPGPSGGGGAYIGVNLLDAKYGLKHDGQMYFDGAMTVGSSTLTTKQPASATESGTTVTLTLGADFSPLSPVPGVEGSGINIPYFFNWKPGGTIHVSGMSVAGYNGTFTITAIPDNSTVQYTAASGLGSGTGGLVWTSAPFKAADVGKLVCVQTVRDSQGDDECGTITSFIDANSVGLSFSSTVGIYVTALTFAYASDDTVAFQAALDSLASTYAPTAVGYIWVGNTIIGLSNTILLPITGNWTFQGAGGGGATTNYSAAGYGIPNTIFMWLTRSIGASSAAFQIGNAAVGTGGGSYSFGNQMVTLRDLAFYGAVGYHGDGGGGYGILGISENGFKCEQCTITNFKTAGIAWNTNWESFTVDNSWITYNGGAGIDGSTTQNAIFRGNSFFQNGKVASNPAVIMGKDTVVIGNTFGNNGDTSSGQVGLGSGAVIGNYSEGQPFFVTGANAVGAVNTEIMGNDDRSYSQISFSAAGTALPAANNAAILTRHPVPVSDATTCTNGGTYVSGGLLHCMVVTDGSAWHSTGAGW